MGTATIQPPRRIALRYICADPKSEDRYTGHYRKLDFERPMGAKLSLLDGRADVEFVLPAGRIPNQDHPTAALEILETTDPERLEFVSEHADAVFVGSKAVPDALSLSMERAASPRDCASDRLLMHDLVGRWLSVGRIRYVCLDAAAGDTSFWAEQYPELVGHEQRIRYAIEPLPIHRAGVTGPLARIWYREVLERRVGAMARLNKAIQQAGGSLRDLGPCPEAAVWIILDGEHVRQYGEAGVTEAAEWLLANGYGLRLQISSDELPMVWAMAREAAAAGWPWWREGGLEGRGG